MNERLATHPSPERLAAFRVGKLSPSELIETESHVSDCPSCCQSLKALPDDSLVHHLREAVTTPGLLMDETHTENPGQSKTLAREQILPVPQKRPDVPAGLAGHPRYRILELLGVGGMGAVYKAEHRLMERTVALKVISN